MKRRFYFVLPDLVSATKTADDLLLARIEDRQMRFLAKRGTELGKLHPAGSLQKSDQAHGGQMGLVLGALCGLALSLAIFFFQIGGFHVRESFVLGMTLFGAIFGFWIGSIIGSAVPNTRLKQFAADMESGKILLMIDLPAGRIDEIKELISTRHPEADARGFEPTIPAFP